MTQKPGDPDYPPILPSNIRRAFHAYLTGRAPACSVNVPVCLNRGRGGGEFRRVWCGRGGLRGCAGRRRL